MFKRFLIEKIDGEWFITYQPMPEFRRVKLFKYLAWHETDEDMQRGGEIICGTLNQHLPHTPGPRKRHLK